MKKLRVVLVGAGNRGEAYTDIMAKTPEKFEVVAVAEPIEDRREYIRKKHGIPEEMCFESWEPLFEKGKIGDVAIISTQDRQHYAPAMRAIETGYNLLLEKPMAVSAKECSDIADAAEKHGVDAIVCHVLRYTRLYGAVKNIIDSGRIGDVVSIDHAECVGNVHQSHSFVRGNWGNRERSTFMLLAKSCHDMDLLQWLIGKKVVKVQSFGSLTYFVRKNAPEGAPERCTDGCPHAGECPYNAIKLYYDDKNNAWFRTTSTMLTNPTDEDVMNTLRTTQYGKCVYKCDNDVVDHQTVSLLFEDGVTATFTMNAFNKGGREMHVFGTKGELHVTETSVQLFDFFSRKTEDIDLNSTAGDITGGHGGGDEGIVASIYELFAEGRPSVSTSGARISADNHLIAFAAEESRLSGKTVDFGEYLRSL